MGTVPFSLVIQDLENKPMMPGSPPRCTIRTQPRVDIAGCQGYSYGLQNNLAMLQQDQHL